MASLTKKGALQNIPPAVDRIDQLLDTTGDGSGTTEQAAAAAEYFYKPGPGVVAVLQRLLIGMQSSFRMDPDEYGDQAALTNGIKVTIKDSSGTVIHDFTPNPITVTWHWGLLAGSDITPSAFQAGADAILIRWTFTKAGYQVTIDGDKGEYLSVNIRDTLAGLTSHLMQVQGHKAIG